ncbi:MAG: hypothetical protein IJZ44_06870 [Lachnospiraceae bacterium]|nr:hypothetical protein [Lachnospiraceae bacterium]
MNYIFELFRLYAGNGIIMGLYFISWVIVFCLEKKRDNRIAFVFSAWYVPLVILNPLVGMVLDKLQILPTRIVRLYWLIPVFFLIAYAMVLLAQKAEGKRFDTVLILLLVALIVISGRYVGNDNTFEKAENVYKLPAEVIEIVDMINQDAESLGAYDERKSVMPLELATYARQYDGTLPLLFGRYPYGNYSGEVYRLMGLEGELDVARIAEYSHADHCCYLVLDSTKEWLGMPEDDRLQLVGTSGNYCLYRLN